jgi:hypothetical protein
VAFLLAVTLPVPAPAAAFIATAASAAAALGGHRRIVLRYELFAFALDGVSGSLFPFVQSANEDALQIVEFLSNGLERLEEQTEFVSLKLEGLAQGRRQLLGGLTRRR